MKKSVLVKEASRGAVPYVSVIIPIYNSERYLDVCLTSLIKQTLANIEIICVDDGSTDSSLEILKEYSEKDDRITVVSQENQYAGVTRNNGLQFARGKYVIFLDSDDFFKLDMLEKTYNKSELEQSEICIFDSAKYKNSSKKVEQHATACMHWLVSEEYPTISGKIAGRYVFVMSHVATWNKLYSREFILKYNLQFQNTRSSNDFLFVSLASVLAERVTFLKETLVYYRRGMGGSIEDTKFNSGKFDFVDALDELRNKLIEYNLYDNREFRIAFANLCFLRIRLGFMSIEGLDLFENLYFLVKDKITSEYEFELLGDKDILNRNVYDFVKDIKELDIEEFSAIYKNKKSKNGNKPCKNITFFSEYLKSNNYTFNGGSDIECEKALSKNYEHFMNKELDFGKLRTFNEKVQWLKLYDSTPMKTRLADKYLVREWINEQIGDKYLIPLLGVWDNFDEIDFNVLPNEFVLKTNHASGQTYIVNDKLNFDEEDASEKFEKWLEFDLSYWGFELHYMNIPPKIIAEKYMKNYDSELLDYKFMCFDGKVEFLWVCKGSGDKLNRVFFTPKWKKMNVRLEGGKNDYTNIRKPPNFNEMIGIVEKLSNGFACARVDLYDIDGSIYFGEMTFTPNGGYNKFIPENFDLKCGKMLKLPEKSPMPVKLNID